VPVAIALAVLAGRSSAERPAAPPPDGERGDSVLAAVERVLHREGLTAALDSLERRAARDTSLAPAGHQLAHALGRDAVAVRGGDAEVIRECRAVFASGCYHGVVEAALRSSGRIDMPGLERLCIGLAINGGPAPGFECLHGLGHGVLGARGGDLEAALRDCDALSTARRARYCHLGAFMEAVNAAANGAHQGHHMGLTIDSADPYSPCRAFGDPYASSCWLFQGYLILRANGFDAARALAVCDTAPDGRAARCYEGVGHQLTGLFQRGDAWIVEQCGRGRADLAPRCAAGATFALDAMDWSGGRAARFCAAGPDGWKSDCWRAAADALVDLATPRSRSAFCAKAEPSWIGACRKAAELDTATPRS
jgi:hypothetical protein